MDIQTIFDVYTKEVRSILELAVPVWHSGLTRLQSKDIERIQKISFKIILGPVYENYTQACKYLATHSLEDRRIKLCLKFARKNLKSENCLFKKVAKNVNTRQSAKLVQEYRCRTSKYKKSSIPYLARLLNSNCKKWYIIFLHVTCEQWEPGLAYGFDFNEVISLTCLYHLYSQKI